MRPILLTLVIFLLFSSGYGQVVSSKLSDLAAIAGCWELRDDGKKALISEQWMPAAGGTMLGMARTVKDGKTTGWEYMRLEQRVDGIFFVSRPKENTEDTDFRLISSTNGAFTFENKTHDFPQRVIYKPSGSTMVGRIEGLMNGKLRGIDFPYSRSSCSN